MITQLLATAVLATGPVPLLDAPQAQSLAVAGDQVIVTRGGPPGRLRVDALAVDGGATRSLLATPRLGPRWTVFGVAFASPQRVAVIANWEHNVDHGPNRVRYRLYTGPPAGPLRVVSTSVGGTNWQRKWIALDAAVDGDRVLVEEARLSPRFRSRLRVFVPGAAPRRLPWGDGILPPLALAGEHVAFNAVGAFRAVVADLESGTRQVSMKVEPDSGVDVAADGTVLGDSSLGLVTAAPGRPRRLVRGSGRLVNAQFAGSRIAAAELVADLERPAVLDAGAVAPRPIGVVTADLRALDADANGVAWLANGCILYAPVDAVAPAEPPAGPCPRVEPRFFEHDQTLRGRRLRVDVDCVMAPATGCHGTVILRVREIAGRGRFHVPSGELGIATVRLPRAAVRIVRRRVHRDGSAALRMTWRVPDARPNRFETFFVVDRVR